MLPSLPLLWDILAAFPVLAVAVECHALVAVDTAGAAAVVDSGVAA